MAPPDKFAEMAPRMKQSLDTLRVLPPKAAPKQLTLGE
jgi:hypothetical protein